MDISSKSMNSPTGKLVLSLVRGDNYAHPGEAEAIDMIFEPFGQNAERHILDVGCGRGGTVDYLTSHGYGTAYGFDIDGESIGQARSIYPTLDFRVCDVRTCSKCYENERFDVFSTFTVLYVFDEADKYECLTQLRELANPGAKLVIFDYTINRQESTVPLHRARWHPIRKEDLLASASKAGWDIYAFRDYTSEFESWYSDLLNGIRKNQGDICRIANNEWYKYTEWKYESLLNDIQTGYIGGAAFYLSVMPSE